MLNVGLTLNGDSDQDKGTERQQSLREPVYASLVTSCGKLVEFEKAYYVIFVSYFLLYYLLLYWNRKNI